MRPNRLNPWAKDLVVYPLGFEKAGVWAKDVLEATSAARAVRGISVFMAAK